MDEAKGGPNWGAFKVPSYLVHPLVVSSIRFHTLVSNAHDAPSLCSLLWRSLTLLCCFGTPLLCSVALVLPHFALSLWRSLTLLCHFGTPSLRSVTFDTPSLRSVAFDAPLLCSVALVLPRFTQSLQSLGLMKF